MAKIVNILYSTLALILASGTVNIYGLITESPVNTVAIRGASVSLNCTSNLEQLNWVLTSKRDDVGQAAQQVVAVNCAVQGKFIADYETEKLGDKSCSLIVKVADMKHAGLYTCSDINPGISAILSVVDSSINIATSPKENIEERDDVVITCALKYNSTESPAPTLSPHFYWKDAEGHNISSAFDLTNSTSAISKIELKAKKPTISPYTCIAYMNLNFTLSSYANNTPLMNMSSTSSPIEVMTRTPDVPIAVIVVVCYCGAGILCSIIFLLNYIKPQSRKQKYNKKFPRLIKFLPCLNQKDVSTVKMIGWVALFSIMTVTVGVIVFPTLMIIVGCCHEDDRDNVTAGLSKG